MQNKEYRTIDKSSWGDGEWLSEPDKVQWEDEATGLPCLAVRHPMLGHWCGYVGVSEGHRYYEADSEIPEVRVHGGLTYSDHCMARKDGSEGVCHLPEPGEDDMVWWLGFDCAHAGDVSPGIYASLPSHLRCHWPGESYKSLEYVKSECRSLAAQLAAQ